MKNMPLSLSVVLVLVLLMVAPASAQFSSDYFQTYMFTPKVGEDTTFTYASPNKQDSIQYTIDTVDNYVTMDFSSWFDTLSYINLDLFYLDADVQWDLYVRDGAGNYFYDHAGPGLLIDGSDKVAVGAGHSVVVGADDVGVDTATAINGSETKVPSGRAVYDFCETTQSYLQLADLLWEQHHDTVIRWIDPHAGTDDTVFIRNLRNGSRHEMWSSSGKFTFLSDSQSTNYIDIGGATVYISDLSMDGPFHDATNSNPILSFEGNGLKYNAVTDEIEADTAATVTDNSTILVSSNAIFEYLVATYFPLTGGSVNGDVNADGNITINNDGTTADAVLSFKDDDETVTMHWDDPNNQFEVSDGIDVITGNIALSGGGTVDGVQVDAHAARHNEGGADPISVTNGIMADDDHGDVEWTSGVATVEAINGDSISTAAKVEDDILQWNATVNKWEISSILTSLIYGELYVDENTQDTTLVSSAGTYYALDAFGGNDTINVGNYSGVDMDADSGRITIQSAGVYYIYGTFSFEHSDATSALVEIALHLNNTGTPTLQEDLHVHRQVTNQSVVGAASFAGYISLAAGDKLDIRVTSDQASDRITFHTYNWGVAIAKSVLGDGPVDSTNITDGGVSMSKDLHTFTEAELEAELSDVTAIFTNNVTGDVTVSGATSTIGTDIIDDTHIDWGNTGNQIDLADIPGGTAPASNFNFANATFFRLPAVNNPSTTAEGHAAWDANDDAIEVYSGDEAESALIPMYQKLNALIIAPDGVNDQVAIMHVDALMYPFGIEIDQVSISLPADAAYTMVFEEWAGDPIVAQADIETVSTTASDSYMEDGTITNNLVDADDYIYLDIPTTDVDWVHVTVIYHILGGD